MRSRHSTLFALITACVVLAGISGCAGDSTSLDNSASGLGVVSNPSAIDGAAGVPYGGSSGVAFTVSGGLPGAEYYWTTTDLPPGLTRTPRDNQTPSATLVFSGTPSCSGMNTVKITVHTSPEHNILIAGQDFVIPISGNTPFLEITPSTVPWPAAMVPQSPTNPQPYRRTLSVCGGQSPYSWSVGSVPVGVSFDQATGTFSQSAVATPGEVLVPVTLVDGKGRTLQKTITLWIIGIADFKGKWTGTITKGAFLKPITNEVDEDLTGHRLSFVLNDAGVLLQGSMHNRVLQSQDPNADFHFNFGTDYPTQLGGYMLQFPWHLDCTPVELDNGTIDCIGHYRGDDPLNNAEFVLTRLTTATTLDTQAPVVGTATFTRDSQDPSSGQETITFSEPMSTGSAVALVGGSGSVGAVSFSSDGTTATIALTGLAAATSYTLTLNPTGQPADKPGFLDHAGNALPKTDLTFGGVVNQPPVAQSMSVSPSAHDRPVTFDLVASDPESTALTYNITSGPANGTLSGTGKTRTYTPAAGYVGPDSFTFTVTDAGQPPLTSASATVTLMITNQAPTATPQSGIGAQVGVPRTITLGGTDPDNDLLTVTILTQPSGTLSGTPPNMTYTSNVVGPDSFTFRVSDGLTPSAPATVGINVTAGNQAPTATPQSVSTPHGQAKAVTLVGIDPEGGALTYTIVTGPTQGTLSGSGATRTYTPASGTYLGPDSFTFKVTDPGSLESAPATVSITMTNQTPTATAQSVTAVQNVAKAITLAGTDLDPDPLTFVIATQPTKGTLTGTPPNMTYTGTTTGSDSFTFTASDGIAASGAATVSITVTAPNQPPTATPQSVSTIHGQAKAITLSGTDPEGGALTFTIVTPPSQGTLSGSGSSRTYTPTSATYVGSDTFTFTTTDPVSLVSAPATVSITMTNQAPTATAQSVTVTINTAKPITLTGVDADNDSLTFTIASQPAHGTVSAPSGPSVTYTPASGYTGTDSFTFTASDGVATSAVATVSLNVVASNQVPVADSQTVNEIPTRQYTTPATFVYFYAITLTGSDAEDGTSTPPLHFKITDFPDVWDAGKTMNMVAGKQYRRWNGSSWELFTATTSTTVDPATGDITVSPAGSPATIIYTPPVCHIDPRLSTTMQFTATDSTGQVSAPGTVGINIKLLFCNHPG